ncbi:hypothetical protein TNCV_2069111 [Trichonephila clavipes]|uniref:Uncharacterized protein n=1 Tax=Trichonephila clavipes TaxID=2585209 RepID=A0A8X6W3P9_TRICX|nr:hypothetical protein TNCV_2069111 [Trichonephila clavipes]
MPRKRVMGGTEILGTSLHDNVIDPEIRDSSFTLKAAESAAYDRESVELYYCGFVDLSSDPLKSCPVKWILLTRLKEFILAKGFSDEFRRLELENLLEKRTSGVRKKEGSGGGRHLLCCEPSNKNNTRLVLEYSRGISFSINNHFHHH